MKINITRIIAVNEDYYVTFLFDHSSLEHAVIRLYLGEQGPTLLGTRNIVAPKGFLHSGVAVEYNLTSFQPSKT